MGDASACCMPEQKMELTAVAKAEPFVFQELIMSEAAVCKPGSGCC
jgi:hypothetical protein